VASQLFFVFLTVKINRLLLKTGRDHGI